MRAAQQNIEDESFLTLHGVAVGAYSQRRVLTLENVELPWVAPALRTINLTLYAQQRVGVIGPNGCGKSTLMKIMAGILSPLAGKYRITDQRMYLDQQADGLDPTRSTLDHIRGLNTTLSESELRMRLAQIGLDARKISTPTGTLSGGERLKAALACSLYSDPPAQLLLLDEPSNHLDLASVQALQAMLRSYPGALIVVSHDDAFLDRLALTHRLTATGHGWSLAAW